MMKPIRGFLLSTAFIGLAWLAFNPHFVVKIQNIFNPKEEALTPITEEASRPVIEQPSNDISDPKSEIPKSTISESKKLEPEIIEREIININGAENNQS